MDAFRRAAGSCCVPTGRSCIRASAYPNRRADGAHTPGPSPEAVKFLLDERDMHGFGVESINIDAGQGRKFNPPNPAHSLILGRGRYGLQCLCNLDQLPATGAVVFAAPLKIKQGSGSPLRVLALVAGTQPVG